MPGFYLSCHAPSGHPGGHGCPGRFPGGGGPPRTARWMPVRRLGRAFAAKFAAKSSGLTNEIPLFKAMRESLEAVASPPQVVVESYHGSSHQVRFTFAGGAPYCRPVPRCELSDLAVVVYDRVTLDARLTYIQAKSERAARAVSGAVAGQQLIANTEQWELLSKRPLINGVRTFNPPRDLLSAAALSSIGSFTFFIHGGRAVEIYYAAASQLHLVSHRGNRKGKVLAAADACQCSPGPECLSVFGAGDFAAFLFGMMIGTPILDAGAPVKWAATSWLAKQLRGFAARERAGRADVATELAGLLDPDDRGVALHPNVGATSLLIFGLANRTRTWMSAGGERPAAATSKPEVSVTRW